MKDIFDVDKFNLIEDEENYYFFRALNMADNSDIEQQITVSENGKIERIRTDRERYEENPEHHAPKYSKNSQISLEQVYDHIKMHYRKDTNCISLSSNANVSISYGRGFYKDKYVIVKVPKKEFGEKVINAGQYMLEEIRRQVEEYISTIEDSKIIETLAEINKAQSTEEIRNAIQTRYTSKEELDPSKAGLRKGIYYRAPHARISIYQALSEEQSLEKNKIVAKLTLLERVGDMEPLIPHTANNNLLVQTIGNAFSSLEVIHYGDIRQENIIDVQKEIVDIFALLQQVEGQDQQIVNELKKEVIQFINEGRNIEIPEDSSLSKNDTAREDITIEEMYELTNGKVEYGMANSIVKNMFYLAKGQLNARALAELLRGITNNNPKYERVIEYIENNGFEIEPQILTRQNKKGYKLSESVSLNLKPNEIGLVQQIRSLTDKEQIEILENGGLSNVRDIMTSNFAKVQTQEKLAKEYYYAEAIFSSYDWQSIGIEQFTVTERNNLLQRIQDKNCVDLYKKLEEKGIDRKDIPKILLNIITRNDFEQYDKILEGDISVFEQELSIERIERFLGYYDVKGTGIQLRPYQQRAVEKTDEIFEKERFASVILPTGAGKSFVALSQLMEHKDEEILYLAPQNEIIEQMKDYIIKYIHGPVNTIGRTKDEIIADIFPKLQFSTYPGLLSKAGEYIINKQYGFVVLDELHRTGAKEWGEKLDTLIDNQTENTKVLGITATPRRDADGKNMANEIAERLGYTNKDATAGKHIAMNMSLTNAIRMGLVVNPKLVSCAYSLKTDGSLENLKGRIEQIEDVQKRNEQLEKYETLRRNLEEAEGIPEILQANVKKGGKYIVFLPVIDEIEDEDGNVIGRKKGKEKLADYEKQILEYFKDSDIKPNFHSMLGEYGDKENNRRLEEFQNRDTDETEFMLVMNKANEGLHLDKLDGIVWLRALDENSRILYLQQLGRVIYSEDPDNPTKDEERPVVIDLVNNTLKVNWDNEITEQDDIELLTIIVDWAEKHDGTLPDINSNDKEEVGYATVLKDIQNKYKEYLEYDFEDLNENQIEEVQEILRIGSLIELWQRELPDRIAKNVGDNRKGVGIDNGSPFQLVGVLKDFVELENEVEEVFVKNTLLKNALKIQNWCKENYGEKPIWERKLPSSHAKDEEEKKNGIKLLTIRSKRKKYEGIPIECIEDNEDRKIIEILRRLDEEYGVCVSLKNALKIENWCKEKYEEKPIWERKLPSCTAKDEEEKKNGAALRKIRSKIKKYEGMKTEDIEDKEDRKIVEIIGRLDEEYGLGDLLKNALKIENWCKENYEEKPIWERKLPRSTAKDEEEKKNGTALFTIRSKIKKYEGMKTEDIEDKEDRKIVEIVRRLDEEYGLGDSLKNALKIENWCKEKYEEKPIWERKLPRDSAKDEEEKKNGTALWKIRRKIKKYEGMKTEDIEDKEDRKIVEIIRRLDEEYGLGDLLKNALKIENWCKENYGEKPIWERKLPSCTAKDEEEKKNGTALGNIRTKIKKYEGMKTEDIEDKEDRKIVEIIRRLDEEYGLGDLLKNALKIENWCKENYGEKPIWERKLPSSSAKDEEEKKNGKALIHIKTKIKKYEGMKTEDIEDKEDRKIVEIIRRLDEEYNPKKLKARDIAQASISSLTDIEMADEEDKALREAVEKTREGGILISE